MKKNVAVDTGFGRVQMISSQKELTEPSFVYQITDLEEVKDIASTITKTEASNGKKILIKILSKPDENGAVEEPKYFLIGELVAQIKPNTERYSSLKRIRDPKHLAQLLSAVGLAVKTIEANVNLGIGLPTALKSSTEDAVKWLKDNFTFSFLHNGGEIRRNITIDNVEVVSQPVAPIFTLEPEQLLNAILSIDLGHKTKDGCLWINRSVSSDYRKHGDGFYAYYGIMREKLEKEFKDNPQNFTEARVQMSLEQGVIKTREGIKNVERLQEVVLRKYAKEVVDFIIGNYEPVIDLIDLILLSGGIIENDKFFNMLQEELKPFRIEVTRGDNPQANVVGGIYARLCAKYKEEETI